MTVPSVSETMVSTRWTMKKACGVSPVKERLSLAMFLMNVGQITHDQTPNATRNQDHLCESFIALNDAWRAAGSTVGVGLTDHR